ncbi:MAG TPA: PEGA domain-containing protein [Candidatus Eisenbacteria bacterium]
MRINGLTGFRGLLPVAFLGLSMHGCSDGGGGGGPQGGRPVIERIVASPNVVPKGGASQFSALATDPDGDSLSYAWTVEAGTLSDNDLVRVGWTAPASAGIIEVRVVVSAQDGADTAFANIAVGSGALRVESDPPGALVYLNASLRPGQTPLQFNNLAVGDYNVQLAGLYFRYEPASIDAPVEDAETTVVSFHLPEARVEMVDTGPDAYDEMGGFTYTEGGFGLVFSARIGNSAAVRAASLVSTHAGTNGRLLYPDATIGEPMSLKAVGFDPSLAFVAGDDIYIGLLHDSNLDGLMETLTDVRRLNGTSGSAYAPAYNLAGTTLAFALTPSSTPNTTDIMLEGDIDSAQVTRVRRVSARGGNYPTYRPDDSIVYESGGELYRVYVDSLVPALPVKLTDTGGHARAPAASPDGDYIAYLDDRGLLQIFIPALGVTTTILEEVHAAHVKWAPNSRELLIDDNPPGGPGRIKLVTELPFP